MSSWVTICCITQLLNADIYVQKIHRLSVGKSVSQNKSKRDKRQKIIQKNNSNNNNYYRMPKYIPTVYMCMTMTTNSNQRFTKTNSNKKKMKKKDKRK